MELQQLLFSMVSILITVVAVGLASEALRSKNNQKRVKTIFCLVSSQVLSQLDILLLILQWCLTQEQPLVVASPAFITYVSLILFIAATLHYLGVLFIANFLVIPTKTKD